MSKGYRSRRRKLRDHDAGRDRHNKGLAWIKKQRRKSTDVAVVNSAKRNRKKAASSADLEMGPSSGQGLGRPYAADEDRTATPPELHPGSRE